MVVSKFLAAASLTGVILVAASCSSGTSGARHDGADVRLDAMPVAVERAADATSRAASDVAGATSRAAHAGANKAMSLATAASEVTTDAWVTTKLRAKFSDEVALERSDIDVTTTDHVVTLRGTVRTAASKSIAGALAAGTEHVRRVVNELVVKEI